MLDLTGSFAASLVGGLVVAGSNFLLSFYRRERGVSKANIEVAMASARKLTAEAVVAEKQGRVSESMQTTRIKPKLEKVLGEAPPGWVTGAIAGETDDFVSGIDHVTVHSGHASAYIRSTVEEPGGFGVLTQKCRSQRFLGKRLRLSGYLRADHIAEWGALWMRVDDADGDVLAFDNMEDRPICGTTEWLKRAVVLDIPRLWRKLDRMWLRPRKRNKFRVNP